MSKIYKERHAKLGCMVLRLFPKTMQMILKDYITPKGLQKRFLKNNFHLLFTKKEIVLMEKLPNMDDFTIEISYKILRFEFNMLDEPKCKWGKCPHDTEVEIADDIQRLINATNSIIKINTVEVTANYSERLLEEIKLMVTRIDSYLEQDDLSTLFSSLCRSETDSSSILQDLARIKAIEEYLPDSESDTRERYSRVSMAIIETFPKILRDVIESIISASHLYQKCVPILKSFYAEQQIDLARLQQSSSFDSLDISVIYKLLRQFSLVPSPTKGWGSFPDKVDIKIGDDIERIRCYRNKLAHRSDTKIDKANFDEYFQNFRDIGHRMDLYFNQKSNYEHRIIRHKTCTMDTEMQAKYENAMKEMENIKLKSENKPIKVYWGDGFERCLMNLRSLLRDEKLEGRQKVRVQIVFQNEDDVESNIEVLNSLKEEINGGLSGIEFIVATKGSIVLHVDILLEMFETNDKLQTALALFLEKILERITASAHETIDVVLLPEEENTRCNKIYLEFDIEAQLLETDDKMVEQFRKINDAIFKHTNRTGTAHVNSSTTLLHINLENVSTKDAFAQAQTSVNYTSVTLRQQLNLKKSSNEYLYIDNCIKTGNSLVFTDYYNKQLILCHSDSTNMHQLPLSYKPLYITEIAINNVAVSCRYDRIILIINISKGSVTSAINTRGNCRGISYNGNDLYVVIERSIIDVMVLTGRVIRTIPLPSDDIHDITVDRERLVCIDKTSIYCCSLEGKPIWKLNKDEYQDLHGVTTDNEGNVYATNWKCAQVFVTDDGKHCRELLTETDGLDDPWGIHFDTQEKMLLVCNYKNRKAFLFDVRGKHKNKHEYLC